MQASSWQDTSGTSARTCICMRPWKCGTVPQPFALCTSGFGVPCVERVWPMVVQGRGWLWALHPF